MTLPHDDPSASQTAPADGTATPGTLPSDALPVNAPTVIALGSGRETAVPVATVPPVGQVATQIVASGASGATAVPAPAVTAGPATAGPWTGSGASMAVQPGMVLSHTFIVEQVVARGGMGEVYRARHVELNTLHAIKVILPELAQDPKLVDLFRREASVLRQVRHDAVVAYDGINRDEFGRLFLVMEFVDGPSLTAVMRDGPFSASDATVLLDRIAAGLAAAHEKGVVHRDISPDNIILPGRRIELAKIIDFGISKQTAPDAATIIGDGFAGKYSYASPEQIGMHGGVVDARSDIYSFGLVLAAVLFGRPLDMGNSPQSVMERRMRVPDLGTVPSPLREVLTEMLAPDPARRTQSAASLIGICNARSRAASKAGNGAGKGSRPVALIVAAGLAAAALIGGVGGYLALSGPASDRPPPPIADKPVDKPAEKVAEKAAEKVIVKSAELVPSPPALAPTVAPAVTPIAPSPAAPQASPPVALASAQPATLPPVPPPVAPPVAAGGSPAVLQPPAIQAPPAQIAALRPAPTPDDVRTRLEQARRSLSCAGLHIDRSGGGRFAVSGYAGSDADLRLLNDRLSELTVESRIDLSLSVRPWPFCEALAIAIPPTEAMRGEHVQIGLNKPSLVYRDGETLLVTVKAGMLSGHLTVDYLDLDGNIVHMVPMPLRRDGRINARQSITLGAEANKVDKNTRVYDISAPFGPGMILAVLTAKPLFAADRPEVERASDYLPALRAKLANLGEGNRELASDAVFFTTVAR
ncbi:serine/threonine kinase [Azospirillum palustre]|uniref:Serine/threonine kinase n=1 Tax=Azospirillum palustre TaxID=2044885 RepID=A0A2B8BKI5_9PROT|nr:serine/threonine protein kinase [Azospirillum palustre]PGH58053.1 serine/threonine kinase [Azospirillum palustre]